MARLTPLLLAHLCILTACAANAQSSVARLSADEARNLVEAAIYPNKSNAELDQTYNLYEPDFIFFEAIDPNPAHGAHMATFAVNVWTGDVWNPAGYCDRITRPKLTEMQRVIQGRSKLSTAEFEKRRAKKPICDAD